MLNTAIALFNVVSLFRLRRRILKLDPKALKAMDGLDPLSSLSNAVFPGWLNDITRLQDAVLFHPNIFPLEILADDKVFALMRRLQKSLVAMFLIWHASAAMN